MSSVTIASKIDNHSHSHNYVKMHLQQSNYEVFEVNNQLHSSYYYPGETDLFDDKAQSNALRYAKEQILKELNDEAIGYISENFKDVNSWLTTKIESTIYTLKSKNG